MTDAIKRKISALLRMGEDARGNEHEAGNAMELAARLMQEHGLSRADLKTEEKPTVTRGDKFAYKTEWLWSCAIAVRELYGTRPVILQDRVRNQKGEMVDEKNIVFFGRAELIDASQQTLKFIIDQIEEQYKLALPPKLTQRERAMYRRDFKEAAAWRVFKRASDIAQTLKTETRASTNSTALTVLDYRAQLDAEIEELFNRLWPKPASTDVAKKKRKPKERKPRRKKQRHWDALEAGDAAGHRVNINKAVKS